MGLTQSEINTTAKIGGTTTEDLNWASNIKITL